MKKKTSKLLHDNVINHESRECVETTFYSFKKDSVNTFLMIHRNKIIVFLVN